MSFHLRLTHSFPMHLFSTPLKTPENLMVSGLCHCERMCYWPFCLQLSKAKIFRSKKFWSNFQSLEKCYDPLDIRYKLNWMSCERLMYVQFISTVVGVRLLRGLKMLKPFRSLEMLSLTHFMSLVFFYTPWKHQKTFCFLMLSGGIERDQ